MWPLLLLKFLVHLVHLVLLLLLLLRLNWLPLWLLQGLHRALLKVWLHHRLLIRNICRVLRTIRRVLVRLMEHLRLVRRVCSVLPCLADRLLVQAATRRLRRMLRVLCVWVTCLLVLLLLARLCAGTTTLLAGLLLLLMRWVGHTRDLLSEHVRHWHHWLRLPVRIHTLLAHAKGMSVHRRVLGIR